MMMALILSGAQGTTVGSANISTTGTNIGTKWLTTNLDIDEWCCNNLYHQ